MRKFTYFELSYIECPLYNVKGKVFFFPEATICKEREDPKYGNIAVKNQQSNSAVSA